MKKFRFEGDPNLYGWKTKPVVGSVYTVKDMNFMRHNFGGWVGIREEDVLKWKDFVQVDMNNFDEKVKEVLNEIETLLISKNAKYGNSALEPLGVFSQLSAKQGLLVKYILQMNDLSFIVLYITYQSMRNHTYHYMKI
jgi:hypothetical protein